MTLQAAVDLARADQPGAPKVKGEGSTSKPTKQVELKPEKKKAKKPTVVDETKDTEAERILKQRKVAVNRLFDKVKLQPVYSDDILKKHKKKGRVDSKRAILEHYEGTEKKLKDKKKELGDTKGKAKAKVKDTNGKGKGKAKEEDEEEGSEMTENQVNEVFAKAVKNDANLPEMDPPSSFALTLRPYQKQALKWMVTMEGGLNDARDELTMHPLWEE